MSASCRRRALSAVLLICLAAGCRPQAEEVAARDAQPTPPPEPLRLLVIDDPELAEVIPRQWHARAERELVVRQMTTEELLKLEARRLGTDAVIYPSGLIGELAQRQLIEPVSERTLDSPDYNRRDIFDLSRQREVAWGGRILAFSFGSPQLTLMYRRDLFERLQLRLPQTWPEYQALVARLSDRKVLGDFAPPDDQPWSAALEPLGEGWAGQLLLVRAAAYAQHRSQFSTLFDYRDMTPLINGPPFVRALSELVGAAKYFAPACTASGPQEVREALWKGRCALALTWPSRTSGVESENKPVPVAFAQLPGAVEAYNFRSQAWERRGDEQDRRVTLAALSGRLGSVTRECREQASAENLLAWLTGGMSQDVCPESRHTTLFRTSHMAQAPLWVDRQLDHEAAESYATTVQDAQSRTAWLASVRIPARGQYLAALDQAVRNGLASESDPQHVLDEVAAQWNAITDTMGREQQREAYMLSIGLQP